MSVGYRVKRRELLRVKNAGHDRFRSQTAVTGDQPMRFTKYRRPRTRRGPSTGLIAWQKAQLGVLTYGLRSRDGLAS